MIIERSQHEKWLSNTWLVADREGGRAVFVDAGGPVEPLLSRVEELGVTVSHVLLTHHHVDHVKEAARLAERFGCPTCGHAAEREHFAEGGDDGEGALELDRELADGEEISTGDLRVRALHVPGHTVGQLSFLVGGERVFTGDTLFRRSVGGTRGPGHSSFEDLRHSILDVLLRLPPETVVHPGHVDVTTVGEEREQNPFVRAWRGDEAPEERPCTALDEPATLLLSARDYDGGTKCWVRFEDGRLDVVPGSRVETR